MKSGDSVVYKKEVLEKLRERSANPVVVSELPMENLEIGDYHAYVNFAGCKIGVNPNAVELAPAQTAK